jgi:hypothetical protein
MRDYTDAMTQVHPCVAEADSCKGGRETAEIDYLEAAIHISHTAFVFWLPRRPGFSQHGAGIAPWFEGPRAKTRPRLGCCPGTRAEEWDSWAGAYV